MKKLVSFLALAGFITLGNLNVTANNLRQRTVEITSDDTFIETELKVKGKCDMCKETIEKTALSIDGVSSAVWDMKAKKLKLSFDSEKTSVEVISSAIAKVGYETEIDKAEPKAYKALSSCCKYNK